MKATTELGAIFIKEVAIYETHVTMPLEVWEGSDFREYAKRSPYYKTLRKGKIRCTCVIIGSSDEVVRDIERLRHYGDVKVIRTIERQKKERRIAIG